MQCVASSAGSEEFRYLAGMINIGIYIVSIFKYFTMCFHLIYPPIIQALPVRKSFRSLHLLLQLPDFCQIYF